MPFNAGTIFAKAVIDTGSWHKSLGGMSAGVSNTMRLAAGIMTSVFGAATVKASNDFLKAFSNVDTVVDETKVNMQGLALEVLRLNPALGDATEITKGLYQSFSAGARTGSEAMATTIASAKFAKAALTSTSTAVDVLTTAVNAYGPANMNAEKAADIFFTTIKDGKTTGEELASSIGNAIPIFASAGIPLEELSAAVATLTKQGTKSFVSVTNLTGVVKAFIKPSKEMKEALEAQGYASGSALLKTEGLTGAMAFLEKATGGNQEAMSKLLPDLEGLKGALALGGEGAKIFAETMKDMEAATGVTEKAFGEQEKTLDTLMNQIKNVQVVLGNLMSGLTHGLAGTLTEFLAGFQNFISNGDNLKTFAGYLANIVGGAKALGRIISLVVQEVFPVFQSTITSVLGNLSNGAQAATNAKDSFSALGKIIAFVSSSFKVVLTFVSGLTKGLVDLVKVVKSVGSMFKNLFTGNFTEMASDAKKAWQSIKNLGQKTADAFSEAYAKAQEEAETFNQRATEYAKVTEKVYKKTSASVKNSLLNNFNEMLTGQKDMTDGTVEGLENITTVAKDTGKAIAEIPKNSPEVYAAAYRMGSVFDDVFSDIVATQSDSFKEMVSNAKENTQQIVGFFANMGSSAMTALSSLVSSVGGFISELYSQEMDKIKAEQADALNALEENYSSKTESMNEAKLEMDRELYDSELEALLEKYENDQVTEEEYKEAVLELDSTFKDSRIISEEEYNAAMARTDLTAKQKKDISDRFFAQKEKALEAQKAADKLKIENDYNKKKDEQAKKAFEASKATKTAGVWLDFAAASLGIWAGSMTTAAQIGLPAALVLGGVAQALVLAQAIASTALIANQQYVPQYGEGTSHAKGGLSIVGDAPGTGGRFGELVNLPAGSEVTPAVKTQELLDSIKSPNGHIINFDFTNNTFGSNFGEDDIERIVTNVVQETVGDLYASA